MRQRWKRWATALCVAASLMVPAPVMAQGVPQILINGKALRLNQTAFVQRNILYFPVDVLEHLGFNVRVDRVKQQASVVKPGRFFVLEAESPVITWRRQGLRMANPPLWQQDTLFVPREFLAHLGLMLSQNVQNQDIRIQTDQNQLQEIQHFPTDVYSRFVFQFARAPQYTLRETPEQLIFELKGVDAEGFSQLNTRFEDTVLQEMRLESTGAYTARIVIQKKYPTPHKVYVLTDPQRLVIDLVKIFQKDEQQSVAPGVRYTRSYQGKSFGPISYHVLHINKDAPYRLTSALAANQEGFTKRPTSHLSRQAGALAAVNATYFNREGLPLGMLMQDQELISSPIYGRTTFLKDYRDNYRIQDSAASLSCHMPLQRQSLAFNSVNLPRQNEQRVLYTPRYGKTTGTRPADNALELQLALDGTVTQIQTHNTPIPPQGFVISAQGAGAKWFQENAYVGMKIEVFSKIWEDLGGVTDIISGGPRLLGDGKIRVTSKQERFQADIASGRAPRTALGISPEGDFILLVVDGRQRLSRGLTLYELAALLREQGAVEAMNFDGGGSSTFVLNHQVKNSPSDGSERAVSTALVLLPK